MSLRLALLAPLPPARSGIADYSLALGRALQANGVAVTYFCPVTDAATRASVAPDELLPLAEFPTHRFAFDLAFYQMGNNVAHHRDIYALALRYPGVILLHDLFLHQFLAHWHVAEADDTPAYVRELTYAAGVDGWQLAQAALRGVKINDQLPLIERLLDCSLGVLVHSQYAVKEIERWRPQAAVAQMPFLSQWDAVKPAGFHPPDPNHVRFLTAGYMGPNKQIDVALRAYAQLDATTPTDYTFVGTIAVDASFDAQLDALQLRQRVHHISYLPNFNDFLAQIAAADVVVALRHPTVGETSATAMQALALGKPLIVTNHGWYAELPDSVALKVPPNDAAALSQAMRRLRDNPEQRHAMGIAAADLARHTHSAANVAAHVQAFCQAIVGQCMAKLA